MAKNRSCRCGGSRVISNACKKVKNGCMDVCTTPICAEPNALSLYAPLIYDEVGINLCTSFELCADITADYPTAANACVQLLDIKFDYGCEGVEIAPIAGRSNCYLVTLRNLTACFAVKIFDDDCRLLDTVYTTAVYLPSCKKSPTYDEDTNPSSVTLEIFAPYGVAYHEPECGEYQPKMALNFIGFMTSDNFVRQGINLYAIPKVLNFDAEADTVTVGLTLVLQSLYFAGYRVASEGKINTPKGSLVPEEDSDCLVFVEGDLLNLAIKPLDLGEPDFEENLKEDCEENGCCACSDVAALAMSDE